jgi:putative aminopeptidase FrvX
MNFKLLEQLIATPAASGEEANMTDFILNYVRTNGSSWAVQPKVLSGAGFQDCVMLVFGKPRTAVYAHMDTIGFTARYQNQLIPIGSPAVHTGDKLQGKDDLGDIICQVDIQDSGHLLHDFARPIARGTALTYAPQWQEDKASISTPYLDNRVGVFTLLNLAAEIQDGVLVFSCGEEHGGGYAGFLARYLFENYGVSQSLIADVTWVTDGVLAGEGVAISLRDSFIPRKAYVDRIVDIAQVSSIKYQLEVEGSGGSDGSEIHVQPYPIDWCFIGAPILHPHAALEIINKDDLLSMISLYKLLMAAL